MLVFLLCALLAIAVVIVVLSPFWLGSGGQLEMSSLVNDPDEAVQLKNQILQRYLKDETAYNACEMTKFEWQKRKQFLENRYIDITRRLDFLKKNRVNANEKKS